MMLYPLCHRCNSPQLLSYSENLTDQALNQLKADNQRLMNEKTALLQVVQVLIYKLLMKHTTVLFISLNNHFCQITQKYMHFVLSGKNDGYHLRKVLYI